MQTLPGEPTDLTPEWLSEALDSDVTGVEVLDHAFATNQRARIGLTYASPGAGPDTMFVKLAPLDPVHREMIGAIGMGEREAQFYADFAASSDLRVPDAYYAASDDDGHFVMLLEDLTVSGCRFSNGEWGVTPDGAARAFEELARFHARFEDPAARDAVAPWLRAPSPRRSAETAQLMRFVLDENADAVSPAYAAVGELFVEHHDQLDALWSIGPETYIHGDTHIGNVFLDGDRVGFLDWGLSRVSTPLRDISYFLVMTVDPDARAGSERDLLQVYVDALRAAGGTELAVDDVWEAHRVQAAYTVVATFLAFMPSYQTADGRTLGKALRERCERALEELDVVDALRAALA